MKLYHTILRLLVVAAFVATVLVKNKEGTQIRITRYKVNCIVYISHSGFKLLWLNFCPFLGNVCRLEVKTMDIKKVDDKPMVIHKKKKSELHVVKKDKSMDERKRLKIVSSENPKTQKDALTRVDTSPKVKRIRLKVKESGASLPKKKGTININLKTAGAVGASATLNNVEGGEEVKDAAKVAYGIYQPVGSTAKRSANIYEKGMMQFRKQRIKQVEKGKKIAKRKIKKSIEKRAVNTSKEVSKTVAKQTAKETARQTAKIVAQTASQAGSTAAGSAAGPYGVLIGYAAGKEVSKKVDKVSEKKKLRNRKISFFLDKMRAQENQQDSVFKLAKDLIAGKLLVKIKGAIALAAAGLVLMLLLVSVIIVPVTAVVAVIYNSPFAIFFPPLEAGDTVITVTGSYVSEFNREVNDLINSHSGYDMGMKVYVDYEGSASLPSNNYDIMAVYMVKYGVGDTATIMNKKSKKRLKEIVDDMCSYTTSTGTETVTDSNGNSTSKSCYYVNITLKTYSDMISEYGFDSDEVSLLNDMMSPESMALLNSNAGDGLATMTENEIDDIVSGISDAKAKKAVEFALTKVGYPYSQEERDSGNYYDCSSLAYYAWNYAGVNISYSGSYSAAAEAEGLVNAGKEVEYADIKPGDLIFYSFCHNGRYDNISHVAIYAGNDKVVEAKSEEYGVVYGSIYSVGNIVHICRP